jgi:lipoate-protein ligase B
MQIRGEKILISLVQLGTIDYATGLRLQEKLVTLRKENKISDVLLLLEHSPVITLGRNAKAANVTASPELLSQRGVELFETNRGGDVTFHGPGQIVGYPIFDLRDYGHGAADALVRRGGARSGPRNHLGAVDFVRRLEEVLIRTCADFAIPTKRVPGLTGVWTELREGHDLGRAINLNPLSSRAEENDSQNRSLESRDLLFAGATTDHAGTAASAVQRSEANHPEKNPQAHDREGHDFSRAEKSPDQESALAAGVRSPEAKLAAIGIHISRFVTSHGFALNVNPDLSFFNLIIPCGITTKPVTSMQQQLGKPLDLNAVAESISRNFGTVFQSQMLWVDSLEGLLGETLGVPMKPPAELRQLRKEDDTTCA